MSIKVNNIEIKGNRRYFGGNKRSSSNKFQRIEPTDKIRFGRLGHGILRPYESPHSVFLKPPRKIEKKFRPDGHLTDQEKAKRLSDLIADTLQEKIDDAIKQKVDTNEKSENSSENKKEESKLSTGAKLGIAVGSLLVIGLAYRLYRQLVAANPKKA